MQFQTNQVSYQHNPIFGLNLGQKVGKFGPDFFYQFYFFIIPVMAMEHSK